MFHSGTLKKGTTSALKPLVRKARLGGISALYYTADRLKHAIQADRTATGQDPEGEVLLNQLVHLELPLKVIHQLG